MTKYTADYVSQLRKIVLHSADVSPDKVSLYLKETAKHGYHYAKEEVLEHYWVLVDHLPEEYVEFALDLLIEKPRARRDPPYAADIDFHELGIDSSFRFFPPENKQGLFLYILSKNEDQGLRLIQTLANTAIANWRMLMQNTCTPGHRETPLPFMLNLQSGRRAFWGNKEVFLWHQPGITAPDVVQAALIALKEWMEEQIKAERSAEALFEKVLSGSDCAAIPGVCLNVALAHSVTCAQAVLPLVCCPFIWRIDEVRIRHFPLVYILLEEASLWAAFQHSMCQSTQELPFLDKEEQEDPGMVAYLQKEMERLQLYTNRSLYNLRDQGDTRQIYFEMPEDVRVRSEAETMPFIEWHNWLRIELWAGDCIKQGETAKDFTPEQAIAAAKEFHRPSDFSAPYSPFGDYDSVRLRAIAGVATAILTAHFDWAQENDHVDWCRNILITASRTPLRDSTPRRIFPSDLRAFAGQGFGSLIAHGSADMEVRKHVLRLLGDRDGKVTEAVFRGLQSAWAVDEALCWNALSLGVACCLRPYKFLNREQGDEEGRWISRLVKRHVNNLENKVIPSLSRIGKTKTASFSDHLAKPMLKSLPIARLAEKLTNRTKLLQLSDDLMTWTIRENTPPSGKQSGHHVHIPYQWNHFFLGWALAMTRSLGIEAMRQHVFTPIRNSWSYAPRLTAGLLQNYAYHIGYGRPMEDIDREAWEEICSWVLDSREVVDQSSYQPIDRDVYETLSLIVFVNYNTVIVESDWPHAALFADIINKWVRIIGYHPDAYASLLTMLSLLGAKFMVESVLEWLHTCISDCADIREFFRARENGDRTAKLLQKFWKSNEEGIRDNLTLLLKYSQIVDHLVTAGIPLASILQRNLERRL